jgi:cardiolipin synthase
MYNWLLKNKIEIYEYKKTVLHGKLSTYDDKFVTVGSYNINNVSAYASIELNLDVMDTAFAKKTVTNLQKIICNECIEITQAAYKGNQTACMRAWQRMCFDTYRVILYLFTFYFKRRHG